MLEVIKLNEQQKMHVNDIYTRIVRKHTVGATESIHLETTPEMTLHEAADIAALEYGTKRAKIIADYEDRIAGIEANAIKRGFQYSTIVIEQLDKALVRKNAALSSLDGAESKMAKKILNDNQKLALSVEKEKSSSRSRSLRDFAALTKLKNTVAYDAQSKIDDELYNAYLNWLTQFESVTAYCLLISNDVFWDNMGTTQFNRLKSDLANRAGI